MVRLREVRLKINFVPCPRIDYIIKHSSADSTGIKAGDIVLEADGRSMKNIPRIEVMRRLQGDVGDERHLTLWRWPGDVLTKRVVMGKR